MNSQLQQTKQSSWLDNLDIFFKKLLLELLLYCNNQDFAALYFEL